MRTPSEIEADIKAAEQNLEAFRAELDEAAVSDLIGRKYSQDDLTITVLKRTENGVLCRQTRKVELNPKQIRKHWELVT